MFKILAIINILPSFSKQQMDLAKAKMANGNHWLPLLCDHKGVNTSLPKKHHILNFFPSVKETESIRKFNWTISPPNSPPIRILLARFLQLRGHHHE
jgi:hypothetical protein